MRVRLEREFVCSARYTINIAGNAGANSLTRLTATANYRIALHDPQGAFAQIVFRTLSESDRLAMAIQSMVSPTNEDRVTASGPAKRGGTMAMRSSSNVGSAMSRASLGLACLEQISNNCCANHALANHALANHALANHALANVKVSSVVVVVVVVVVDVVVVVVVEVVLVVVVEVVLVVVVVVVAALPLRVAGRILRENNVIKERRPGTKGRGKPVKHNYYRFVLTYKLHVRRRLWRSESRL